MFNSISSLDRREPSAISQGLYHSLPSWGPPKTSPNGLVFLLQNAAHLIINKLNSASQVLETKSTDLKTNLKQGCSKNGRYKGGKLGKYRGNMTNRPPLWLSFVCNWIGATLFNDKFQSTCCFSRAPKEPAARNVAKPQRKGFRPKSLRCLSFAPCPHAHHFRI